MCLTVAAAAASPSPVPPLTECVTACLLDEDSLRGGGGGGGEGHRRAHMLMRKNDLPQPPCTEWGIAQHVAGAGRPLGTKMTASQSPTDRLPRPPSLLPLRAQDLQRGGLPTYCAMACHSSPASSGPRSRQPECSRWCVPPSIPPIIVLCCNHEKKKPKTTLSFECATHCISMSSTRFPYTTHLTPEPMHAIRETPFPPSSGRGVIRLNPSSTQRLHSR